MEVIETARKKRPEPRLSPGKSCRNAAGTPGPARLATVRCGGTRYQCPWNL